VEEHVVGLVVLVAVAVDALALRPVIHGYLVVENLRLLERGEVALDNLHEAPCGIRRFDEPIRQVFVDRLSGNMNLKRTERQPPGVLPAPDLYLDVATLGDIEHGMPVRLGHLHLHAVAVGLLLAVGCGEPSHARRELAGREHEVQRCYVAGHGDVTIVGEDGWQGIGPFG